MDYLVNTLQKIEVAVAHMHSGDCAVCKLPPLCFRK